MTATVASFHAGKVLVSLTEEGGDHGGCPHRFDTDRRRNNAWPEPFSRIDKITVNTYFDRMVNNGYVTVAEGEAAKEARLGVRRRFRARAFPV